jgi:hypothetical protein
VTVHKPFHSGVAEHVRFNLSDALARWENEGGADKEKEPSDLFRGAFSIDPVPPFRLDLSAWALRRRPGNAIDLWDGTSYRRGRRRLANLSAQVLEELRRLTSRLRPLWDALGSST